MWILNECAKRLHRGYLILELGEGLEACEEVCKCAHRLIDHLTELDPHQVTSCILELPLVLLRQNFIAVLLVIGIAADHLFKCDVGIGLANVYQFV